VARADKRIDIAPSGRKSRNTPAVTRAAILAAARAHLERPGAQRITVADIMDRTGLGRSSFYAHFHSPYHVAEIFIREAVDEIDMACATAFSRTDDLRDALQHCFAIAVAYWQRNGRLLLALDRAQACDERLAQVWMRLFMSGPVALFTDIIEKYQAIGAIGPMNGAEVSFALNMFTSSYLNQCFGGGVSHTPETVRNILEQVWFGALFQGRT